MTLCRLSGRSLVRKRRTVARARFLPPIKPLILKSVADHSGLATESLERKEAV